nr:MAG TPA: hypothetical protein [Caudoviricetes sp.]DAQ85691.1 MAG TPA: hypothetical protein [Caudoviricetes sp.]
MGRATGRGSRAQNRGFKGGIYPRPRKEEVCGQRRYQPRRRPCWCRRKEKAPRRQDRRGKSRQKEADCHRLSGHSRFRRSAHAETVSHAVRHPEGWQDAGRRRGL